MAVKRIPLKRPLSLGEVFSGKKLEKKAQVWVSVYKVQQNWPTIVGADLASRTQPKNLKANTLIVAVENPAWAHQLSMIKMEVLKALQDKGLTELKDLRFITEPIHALPARKKVEVILANTNSSANQSDELADILKRIEVLRKNAPKFS